MEDPFFIVDFLMGLKELGWPRKRSIIGKVGVPEDVLRASVASTLHSAMAIGAGRPYRACQLISQQFQPSWTTTLANQFFVEVDPAKWVRENPEALPWDVLTSKSLPPRLGDFLSWKGLLNGGLLDVLGQAFARGLVFGFLYPDETKVALDVERERFSEMLPLAVKAGFDAPSKPAWPDNDSFFAWLDASIAEYESRVKPLPEPPSPFMAAAAVRKRLS